MMINGIDVKGQVILGPMAGVTTLSYREFMKPFGVALSFTEMVSDAGLVYGNRQTLEYIRTEKKDRPVGIQLFGHDTETTLKAIDVLEREADYDLLDLNCGCPVHKVVKTGAGSAWLKNPQALYEYVRAVVEKSQKPVSVKIRLGWDEKSVNALEVALLMEKAGVSLLTVHARTRSEFYAGKADYESIRGLGDKIGIPLCVSGDIFTAQDAVKAMEITKASYVMVARRLRQSAPSGKHQPGLKRQ